MLFAAPLQLSYPYRIRPASFEFQGTLNIEPETTVEGLAQDQSYELLNLRDGERTRQIRSLGDFVQLVKVPTANAALDFCRLDSGPFTFNLFNRGDFYVEITPREKLDRFLFGLNPSQMGWTSHWTDGTSGIVDDETWKRLSLSPPKVEGNSTRWTVFRYVLRCQGHGSKAKPQVAYVREEIVPRKEFRRTILHTVDLPNVEWSFRPLSIERGGGLTMRLKRGDTI